MESQSELNENESKKTAEEILETVRKKYEKEKNKKEWSKDKYSLKVKVRIPVSISPEVKKKLRENMTPKEKTDIIIVFKEPKPDKARIKISKEKRKDIKADITLKQPETPTPILSPTLKAEEPLNKDVLMDKMKKQRRKKKKRRK